MSTPDFRLESPPADLPPTVSAAEWCDRIDRLTHDRLYRKLGIWDQDFLTDINGLRSFTTRQRSELQRIWNQWGDLA